MVPKALQDLYPIYLSNHILLPPIFLSLSLPHCRTEALLSPLSIFSHMLLLLGTPSPTSSPELAQGPSLRNLCWQHLTPHLICSPLLSPDIKYTNSIITLIALMTSGYGYLTVQLPVWGSAEKWGLQSHLTSHMLMLPPISYGAWHKFLNPSVPHFPHLQSERVIMVPASQAVVRMKWANIWRGLGTECGAGPPLHQC